MDVILLAKPEDTGNLDKYLIDENIDWRPDPSVSFTENLMEFAGRICYSAFKFKGEYKNKNLTRTRKGNDTYIENLIKSGHTSVFEHGGPLTFLLKDVSRVCLMELIRHRVGTAYSQTSGRYVREDFDMYVPDCIQNNELALDKWNETVNEIKQKYLELESVFEFDDKPFSYKKEVTSALRRILPNGMTNHMVFSCNHRTARHIINLRCTFSAEEEIRKMTFSMAEILKKEFKNIYQDMRLDYDNGVAFFKDYNSDY